MISIKRGTNIIVTNGLTCSFFYLYYITMLTLRPYCQVITEIRCFPSIFMVNGFLKRT